MELSVEKQLRDLTIIKEELEPLMLSLEEKEVDTISVIIFFSSYVKELLNEIDNKKEKELIIRNMLD